MQKRIAARVLSGTVLAILMIAGVLSTFAAALVERIDATAFGTTTLQGKTFPVSIRIYQFSRPEDRQTLIDAFEQGQNAGLVKALAKMKSVGRISMPGTIGYDIAYAVRIPTPTGRKIRIVTNRRITFGEAYRGARSEDYNLSAGEFDINEQEKDKSTGVLIPAARITLSKDGQLTIDVFKSPWTLRNIIDWNDKGKGKVEGER